MSIADQTIFLYAAVWAAANNQPVHGFVEVDDQEKALAFYTEKGQGTASPRKYQRGVYRGSYPRRNGHEFNRLVSKGVR